MRKAHIGKCLDITVKRGAECNTDHMMLLMKLHLGKKRFRGEVVRGSSMYPNCKGDAWTIREGKQRKGSM